MAKRKKVKKARKKASTARKPRRKAASGRKKAVLKKKAAKAPARAARKKKIVGIAKRLNKMARLVGPKANLPPMRKRPVPRKALSAAQLREYRETLQKLRDRVVDEISFLAGDNLNRSQRDASGDLSSYSFHMADHGTDNFDREFALNLVSTEQDALYEIDDALRRIDLKTYGVCEDCGKPIERARLKALPFARMCITCKSLSEKGKSHYRPFGPTISQSGES